MSGKVLFLILLGLFLFTSGCLTTNWTHNRRHFRHVREEIRQLHQDFDRIFLDLEPYPAEQ
jgi:site-specific recombinase